MYKRSFKIITHAEIKNVLNFYSNFSFIVNWKKYIICFGRHKLESMRLKTYSRRYSVYPSNIRLAKVVSFRFLVFFFNDYWLAICLPINDSLNHTYNQQHLCQHCVSVRYYSWTHEICSPKTLHDNRFRKYYSCKVQDKDVPPNWKTNTALSHVGERLNFV